MTESKPVMQRMLGAIVGMMEEGKWVDALASWGDFATRYSDLAATYLGLARELRDLGQSEEAESIYRKMLDRFPANLKAAFDYAMMAYARREWPEAIRRFQIVRSRFPDVLDGQQFVGDLLFGQRRFDEADVVLCEAMSRFPDEPRLAISYAWSAHLKADKAGNWREASERWYSLVSRFPGEQLGYAMLGFVLTKHLGRIDEAETFLLAGMERFPDNMAIARQYAQAADYRHDWVEALRRWDALVARWPNERTVLEGRGETEARQRLIEIDSPQGISTPAVAHQPEDPESQSKTEEGDLLMQFESLGENCEFGLVQRHFGVEPLGLLRWVSLAPEALCVALEERFDGLEDPEDLEIKLIGPEYHSYGRRYQMRMHTYILESEYKGSPKQLKAQLFRRLRFLKDKLLDDLRSANKILVWQSGVGSFLSEETVCRMQRAVVNYGDNTLLVVRRHEDQSRPPIVEQRLPGLLVATLHQVDKLTASDGKVRVSSPFDGWLTLCREALSTRLETLGYCRFDRRAPQAVAGIRSKSIGRS
jgi:tetratricopeptide (TPR) repeat protein